MSQEKLHAPCFWSWKHFFKELNRNGSVFHCHSTVSQTLSAGRFISLGWWPSKLLGLWPYDVSQHSNKPFSTYTTVLRWLILKSGLMTAWLPKHAGLQGWWKMKICTQSWSASWRKWFLSRNRLCYIHTMTLLLHPVKHLMRVTYSQFCTVLSILCVIVYSD